MTGLSSQHALRAVRLSDGSSRRLDAAAPIGQTLSLARSGDGTALYYFSTDGMLRDALSGRSVAVGHGQDYYIGAMAASDDGGRVLYWEYTPQGTSAGVTALIDVAAGTSTEVSGCSRWLHLYAFEPSGQEAVCASEQPSGGTAPLTFFDTATGTALRQGDSLVGRPSALQWRPDGLLVVGTLPGGAVAVTDVSAAASKVVYRVPAASSAAVKKTDFPIGIAPWEITLDRGGRQVGLWQVECRGADSDAPPFCGPVHAQLMVIDGETGFQRDIKSIDVVLDFTPPGTISFSDDGAYLAYRIGSDVYVRRIH